MKKKTIKIGFRYFWPGFNPEKNFFTDLLRKNYQIIISDNPDYVFYCVYPELKEVKDISKQGELIKKISPSLYILARKLYSNLQKIRGKHKIPPLKGNFVKIFYGAEHTKPNMHECDWAFGSHFEEEINNPKYMRLLPYLPNDYILPNLGNPLIKKNINFKKIKKEKTKFCNFIYSQDISSRNNFFKELSKYKKIDAPGRCMNNMPPIGSDNPKKSRLSENWVKEKLRFIKPYKFTIAFENKPESGWVTEKLTHPMLVNSIPIYFGHKDISKDFNTKSFINYNDFKNMKELIQHIIKVDNDEKLYNEYIKQPFYPGNKYTKDIHPNFSRFLKRFKEIFG
ncbi:MAG: glycosyltransferase family 10 [Candidatus Pacearchaeota archaeon]|jgi:hypothetical protein